MKVPVGITEVSAPVQEVPTEVVPKVEETHQVSFVSDVDFAIVS
jgi:hypothetical protein